MSSLLCACMFVSDYYHIVVMIVLAVIGWEVLG